MKTDTGDSSISEVRDAQQISVEIDTGKVELTNTGDVKGTLVSDKVFLTETDTGDIELRIPQ